MNILKYFEKFTEEQAKQLENDKKIYLKFLNRIVSEPIGYQSIINEIKRYNISNFICLSDKPYDYVIKPDKNFIKLIEKLNNYIKEKISLDINFHFTYDVYNLNRMEFELGIPKILRNTGLGYKLYTYFIKLVKFVVSDRFADPNAIHVWRYLILNDDFYSFTSKKISGLILKKQTNNEIRIILDNIKNYNSNVIDFSFSELIFDDELEEKIKEIYETLDIYKQEN